MRASGILLPVFSLPSRYGIGCFSKEAYTFAEQLARAGQRYWQILPLGPTSYGDSPYQSFSSYAGNPYFVDLDFLCEDGLLKQSELELDWGRSYGPLWPGHYRVTKWFSAEQPSGGHTDFLLAAEFTLG